MDITKVDLEEGEQMLVFHLTKEAAKRYNNILQTRNLTQAEFMLHALSLYENFTKNS